MQRKYTVCGMIAVVIWSTGSAFCHTLTESWGILSGALVNFIAGSIAVIYQYRLHKWCFLKGRNLRFWLTCGLLYMIYVAANYGSSLLAVSREQVIALTLIKSTWPILAYVFLFLLQRRQWDFRFVIKVVLLTAGLLLSNIVSEDGNIMPAAMLLNCLPAICIGFASSVAWALYSNAIGMFEACREDGEGDCAGVFMIAAAFAVAAISLLDTRQYTFSLGGSFWFQLIFNAVVGVFIANVLWNKSVVRGDRAKVFSFSNLLPVLSVLMSTFILEVKMTLPVLLGSALIVAGTAVSTEPVAKKKEKTLIV